MPENLINRLNQQNDLAVLQKNIVQDKSLLNMAGFFNIIYLPDLIQKFPWQLVDIQETWARPLSSGNEDRIRQTYEYIKNIHTLKEVCKTLIKNHSPYCIFYEECLIPLTNKNIYQSILELLKLTAGSNKDYLQAKKAIDNHQLKDLTDLDLGVMDLYTLTCLVTYYYKISKKQWIDYPRLNSHFGQFTNQKHYFYDASNVDTTNLTTLNLDNYVLFKYNNPGNNQKIKTKQEILHEDIAWIPDVHHRANDNFLDIFRFQRPIVFYADEFEQYDLTYMPVQNETKGPVKIDTIIHTANDITQNNFYLYSGELQRLFKL